MAARVVPSGSESKHILNERKEYRRKQEDILSLRSRRNSRMKNWWSFFKGERGVGNAEIELGGRNSGWDGPSQEERFRDSRE